MRDIKALSETNGPDEPSERLAFCRWINGTLKSDDIVHAHLPLSPDNDEIYDKMNDGLIFIQMLNYFFPSCIQRQAVHINDVSQGSLSRRHRIENISLAFVTSVCYGCDLARVNIFQVFAGVKTAVLELIWQIMRVGFTHDINLQTYPELAMLKRLTETVADLRSIPSSELVLRHVNHLLGQPAADDNDIVKSFADDFSDGSVYQLLTTRLFPISQRVTSNDETSSFYEDKNPFMVALKILDENKIGYFLHPDNYPRISKFKVTSWKLHYLTFHMVFRAHRLPQAEFLAMRAPPLPPVDSSTFKYAKETNGERYLRYFLNSFGVEPYCSDLAPNTRNGLLIVQALEQLDRFVFRSVEFVRMFAPEVAASQRVHNGEHALLKMAEYQLVRQEEQEPLHPEWVSKAHKPTIMRMVFALMNWWLQRGPVQPVVVMDWVNEVLDNTHVIHSFRDLVIAEKNLFARVLNRIEPHSVDVDLCKDMDRVEFVRYYLSVARRLGYLVFVLPEQMISCEYEPVMMAFAVLMHRRRHPGISCDDHLEHCP